MKKWIWMGSSIFVLFLVWTILHIQINHALIMPSFSDVFKILIRLITHIDTLSVIGSTLIRLIVSIFASLVIAVVLGILGGLFESFSLFLKPHVAVLRTVPVISITVILFILLGFEIAPYVITFLMVFPIVYQATEEGIKSIDRELLDVYRLEEHNLFLSIKMMYYPLIKPFVFLSLLQSFGLGIKVLVMAEYLSQTKNSIGNALYLARINIAYGEVFAWTLILILISLGFEGLLRFYQNKRKLQDKA
jgi:NitT/TauT family transport system permease protein